MISAELLCDVHMETFSDRNYCIINNLLYYYATIVGPIQMECSQVEMPEMDIKPIGMCTM